MQTLRIFGAGVRAAVVADLVAWQFDGRLTIDGYYDDRRAVGEAGPSGFPIRGTVTDGIDELAGADILAFIATGTRASSRGCHLLKALMERKIGIASLISPEAHIAPSARIGLNALIMPGVFVGAFVEIGHLCTAHGGVVIEHHGRIGHNVLLAPSAAASGFAQIESHTFIGIGSRILPEARVGTGTMLGGGSTVLREVPPHVIAFGTPAVAVRAVRPGDEVPTEEEIRKLAAINFA